MSIATRDRLYIVEDMLELQCSAPNKLQIFVQDPLTPHVVGVRILMSTSASGHESANASRSRT
jgi:hypothetical protein